MGGTLPEYYHNRLLHIKNDYSDDLPGVDVRTLPTVTDERTHAYKCQVNSMMLICSTLRAVVADEVVTDRKTKKEIEQFLKSDLHFTVGDPKNAVRMKRVNQMLDKAIAKLSK